MTQSSVYARTELTFRERSRTDFLLFIKYTKRNFTVNWHHRVLADKLQDFAEGKIKKLMIFLQPQVGKSEMSTRRLPAFMLGSNPNLRIGVCAYNQTFASKFNRDLQRIIDDPLYRNIFPGTRLNDNDGYVRNSEEFEIVGNSGSLKTVGVNGALTGNPIDVGIIDDPIKDAVEAYSSTFRERVWDWYTTVFQSRLHNNSQQLITLTRWHEDDLAGRIMKAETDWEILIFPAIKEDHLNPLDTREIGEALWPERHSLKRMLDIKKQNEAVFTSLYQQRPYFNAEEGRFAYAFSRAKHVGRCSWNPMEKTYLSFDFNRNPICCTVFQWYNDTIYVERCIKLKNSNIYALVTEITKYYPNALFVVTGDATGHNSTAMVQDNLNYYIIIQRLLSLSDGQLKVNSINPKIEYNQVLINSLLQNYHWVIDEENAAAVIFDMEYVKMLPDGTIDKSSRTDPTKQADALDTVRYWCDMFMKWFLKQTADNLPGVDLSKVAKPVALPEAPKVGSIAGQAISAIKAGHQVFCNRAEYYSSVRLAIINQVDIWIGEKQVTPAQFALNEIQRLDGHFGASA